MFRIEPREIGFGTYNFMGTQVCGGKSLGWPALPRGQKEGLLKLALDSGINFIDTSDFYGLGSVEALVGEVIGNNANVILATKGGKTDGYENGKITRNFSPSAILAAIDSSRRKLRRDIIDLYQLHGPREEDLSDRKLWDALAKEREKGNIHRIGVSPTRNGLLDERYFELMYKNPMIDFIQISINLSCLKTLERIEILRGEGKRIIARSLFSHGLIFKKNDLSDIGTSDPRRDFFSADYDSDLLRRITATRIVLLDFLKKNNSLGLTLAQLFILIVKSLNISDVILFGASKFFHVTENSAVASMPNLDLQTIASIKGQINALILNAKD